MKYFVIYVWGDVEPSLIGPYDTEEERDAAAIATRATDLRNEGEFYSGIYWLDIDDNGIPTIGSWSGNFFEPTEQEVP